MSFEVFDKSNGPGGRLRIRYGALCINRVAMKDFEGCSDVILLVDGQSGLAAIEASPVPTKDSYRLTRQRGGGGQITCVSFLKKIEMNNAGVVEFSIVGKRLQWKIKPATSEATA